MAQGIDRVWADGQGGGDVRVGFTERCHAAKMAAWPDRIGVAWLSHAGHAAAVIGKTRRGCSRQARA